MKAVVPKYPSVCGGGGGGGVAGGGGGDGCDDKDGRERES